MRSNLSKTREAGLRATGCAAQAGLLAEGTGLLRNAVNPLGGGRQ